MDSRGNILTQGDTKHHGLDEHLRDRDIHLGDNLFNGSEIPRRRHDHYGVDPAVRQNLDVLLAQLPELALRVPGECRLGGGVPVVAGSQVAVVRLIVGAVVDRLLGGALVGSVYQFVQEVCHALVAILRLCLRVTQADNLHGDFGRGLDVQHLDNAREERHVRGAGNDDQLVGAFVRHNLHLPADHASIGITHERIAHCGSLRGGGVLLRGVAPGYARERARD